MYYKLYLGKLCWIDPVRTISFVMSIGILKHTLINASSGVVMLGVKMNLNGLKKLFPDITDAY